MGEVSIVYVALLSALKALGQRVEFFERWLVCFLYFGSDCLFNFFQVYACVHATDFVNFLVLKRIKQSTTKYDI